MNEKNSFYDGIDYRDWQPGMAKHGSKSMTGAEAAYRASMRAIAAAAAEDDTETAPTAVTPEENIGSSPVPAGDRKHVMGQ